MTTDPTSRLRSAVNAKAKAIAEEEAAIVEALTPGSGVQQKEVVAITGYSREHIRRIARTHGIAAPRPASRK